MIRHFSADFIIPVSGGPIKDGIVSVDDTGRVVNLAGSEDPGAGTIKRFKGIIVPGFVNTHCHLELSHLAGKIPGGNGLIPFLSAVMAKRTADHRDILEAMELADKAMQENGIVAVGDISNNSLSKTIKRESPIHYHTFVEFIGFDPQNAEAILNRSIEILKEFEPLPASLAPHAPYSVSKALLKLLRKNTTGSYKLTSMHNQESDEENKLYRYKTGKYIDFYKSLNLNIDFFKPHARNSIQSLLPLFSSEQRILLVHNTFTNLKDIYFARRMDQDVHWCFCPKANLYLEKKLPVIEMFLSENFNITLGTDSLASNDKLCILSELKTIKKYFPSLSFTETIPWATLNGAKFLGVDDKYGSIEKGKTPGLNLISNTEGLELTALSHVRKLV
ncbi:MAG: amidohydrolase family protein [Daejeonella sp.]